METRACRVYRNKSRAGAKAADARPITVFFATLVILAAAVFLATSAQAAAGERSTNTATAAVGSLKGA